MSTSTNNLADLIRHVGSVKKYDSDGAETCGILANR